MKVLLAASEVAPIIKIGGLGDVAGSLPKALEEIGLNVDVIAPFYPTAKVEGLKIYKSIELNVPFGNANNIVEVFKTKLPGSDVDVILLKNDEMFHIGGEKAFQNNRSETELFSFFDRAVVEFIKSDFNTYDLIHCNDWHTGLITHLLEDEIGETRPATLITVHNLGYQGEAGMDLIQEVGINPGEHRLIDWDISEDNKINLLLQGITSSDYISTVSPTYAKEILFKDIGGELSDILQNRQARLVGILNGIDYSQFPRDFDADDWKDKKGKKKAILQEKMGLEVDESKPVFGFVSRLDPNQKGLDILIDVVPEIVKQGGQFILLGTGEESWQEKFTKLGQEAKMQSATSINIEFDVKLATEIYAGCDFFLIPSKYEPCGLTQMISMYYGTIPVAHETGGLKDSIDNGENGFLFNIYSSKEFNKALTKAFNVYGTDEFVGMVENAMKKDFSWKQSAKEYKTLYEKAIQVRKDAIE